MNSHTQIQPSLLPSANPRVPAAQHPFRHCMPMQIRFTDIDMIGHLNNNVYLTFMDLAKIDYFTTLRPGEIDMHNLNMVVVHIDVDFYSPTFFGQEVDVWTTVTSVGHRSLHMEQRIVARGSSETKCIGRVVMSGFDPATNTSLPIADEWVAALERYEHRPYPRT
ncbi:MAG: acyl-CoA thioesterase [Muribaculaceae bacterium]|nr:acyl-CoA thioesterase [Muribaculaceae bacterium]